MSTQTKALKPKTPKTKGVKDTPTVVVKKEKAPKKDKVQKKEKAPKKEKMPKKSKAVDDDEKVDDVKDDKPDVKKRRKFYVNGFTSCLTGHKPKQAAGKGVTCIIREMMKQLKLSRDDLLNKQITFSIYENVPNKAYVKGEPKTVKKFYTYSGFTYKLENEIPVSIKFERKLKGGGTEMATGEIIHKYNNKAKRLQGGEVCEKPFYMSGEEDDTRVVLSLDKE